MTRKQHLNEILWIEKCTLRTKKSKYFTEEFFELCKIKKYKELFRKTTAVAAFAYLYSAGYGN